MCVNKRVQFAANNTAMETVNNIFMVLFSLSLQQQSVYVWACKQVITKTTQLSDAVWGIDQTSTYL